MNNKIACLAGNYYEFLTKMVHKVFIVKKIWK